MSTNDVETAKTYRIFLQLKPAQGVTQYAKFLRVPLVQSSGGIGT